MSRWGRRIALLVLAFAGLTASGCNKYLRVAEAHQDTQNRLGYVQGTSCAQNQKVLNRAVEKLWEKDEYALDGVETGSKEWWKVLDKSRVLPMAIPCMAGGKYVSGPRGKVICSKHGDGDHLELTHPDAGRDDPVEPPDVHGEHLALASWGIGFLFLMAAGYNYTAGGDDADLVEALNETPTSPPGAVVPDTYAVVEGVAGCEENLLAPRVRTHVVFYRYLQLEEWQEQDKNKIWHTVTRTLKEETQIVPFVVEGKGGSVEVAAGGARLEGKRLLRDVIGASGSATNQGGGGFGLTGKYRNHRYIHEVYGLEVGQPALVAGRTVAGADGGARFENCDSEERPYVVSARGRQDLTQRARDRAGVAGIFMWGFGVLAVVFLVGGFLVDTGV